MTYRNRENLPYNGVVCGLCNKPPQAPTGIQGWVFDQNLISCLSCRKQGQSIPDEVFPNPAPKILDKILAALKRLGET